MADFFQPGNTQTVAVPKTADPNALLNYITSLDGWLQALITSGVQHTPVTEDQLDQLVSENNFANSGKTFYTTDTNKFYGVKIVSNALVKKEFAA